MTHTCHADRELPVNHTPEVQRERGGSGEGLETQEAQDPGLARGPTSTQVPASEVTNWVSKMIRGSGLDLD